MNFDDYGTDDESTLPRRRPKNSESLDFNARPFPNNSSNNYGNSYNNAYGNFNKMPSDFENSVKEFIISQKEF